MYRDGEVAIYELKRGLETTFPHNLKSKQPADTLVIAFRPPEL